MLSRSEILACSENFPRVEVDVPALGGTLFVRALSVGEAERFTSEYAGPGRQVLPALVALTTCDEHGAALFSLDDVPRLEGLPIGALKPIFDAAIRLNDLSDRAVEAEVKNS